MNLTCVRHMNNVTELIYEIELKVMTMCCEYIKENFVLYKHAMPE